MLLLSTMYINSGALGHLFHFHTSPNTHKTSKSSSSSLTHSAASASTMGGHNNMILKSQELVKYILETSSYPNEHQQLKELREATVDKYKYWSLMNLPVDEAQLLSMFLKIMNPKKTIELGVFTGYSLLSTALALPDDAKIIAVDPDREAYEFGLPFLQKAQVDHKVNFIESDGVSVLNNLIEAKEEGTFDFAFVDADKENYLKYHELLLKLVKVGGVIAYDNTLWSGTVASTDDDDLADGYVKDGRDLLRKLNSFLPTDPRIEVCLVSVGDGLTLCRRIS